MRLQARHDVDAVAQKVGALDGDLAHVDGRAQLEPDVAAEATADMRRAHEVFAHTVLLPMLGLPLGEMFFLDDLADDCAADGTYEFMFTSAPLNLPHGVASPPNALAIK